MGKNDFIGVDVVGMDKVKEALVKFGPEARKRVADDATQFMLMKLKKYPSSKSVSRSAAYGKPFFTDKQRRFFFAALHDGTIRIPYRRTQEFSKGWKVIGRGERSIIANEVPYGSLLMDDKRQSRHARLIGWQTVGQVVANEAGSVGKRASSGDTLMKRLQSTVRDVIRKLGFKV